MTSSVQEKFKIVAQRYSSALTKIADEKNLWIEIDSDLKNIVSLFNKNKDIEQFLLHPTITLSDKKDVIKSAFEHKISDTVYNFINILLEKNRLYILATVAQIFQDKLNKKNNIISVTAVSAVELDEDLKNRLVSKLEVKLSKKVVLASETDSNIIAGVILKFDDKIIDGSLKARLEQMKKQLI